LFEAIFTKIGRFKGPRRNTRLSATAAILLSWWWLTTASVTSQQWVDPEFHVSCHFGTKTDKYGLKSKYIHAIYMSSVSVEVIPLL